MDQSGVTRPFNLYLIRRSGGRCLFFSPADEIAIWERASDDRMHQGILWLTRSRYRIVAWFGRVLEGARSYHGTLEDRLDPSERFLRAMASAKELSIHHGSASTPHKLMKDFRATLARQRIKHKIWFALDIVAIAIAIPLSPLPGPNLVLYYPVLRIFSHYRALRGIRAGMAAEGAQLRLKMELDDLESAIRSPDADRTNIGRAVDALNLQGLGSFIERML